MKRERFYQLAKPVGHCSESGDTLYTKVPDPIPKELDYMKVITDFSKDYFSVSDILIPLDNFTWDAAIENYHLRKPPASAWLGVLTEAPFYWDVHKIVSNLDFHAHMK